MKKKHEKLDFKTEFTKKQHKKKLIYLIKGKKLPRNKRLILVLHQRKIEDMQTNNSQF